MIERRCRTFRRGSSTLLFSALPTLFLTGLASVATATTRPTGTIDFTAPNTLELKIQDDKAGTFLWSLLSSGDTDFDPTDTDGSEAGDLDRTWTIIPGAGALVGENHIFSVIATNEWGTNRATICLRVVVAAARGGGYAAKGGGYGYEEVEECPVMSAWGLAALTLLVMTMGTIMLRLPRMPVRLLKDRVRLSC